MSKAPNLSAMRMAKEMLNLTQNPPHGITCWAKDNQTNHLEASKLVFNLLCYLLIHAWFTTLFSCSYPRYLRYTLWKRKFSLGHWNSRQVLENLIMPSHIFFMIINFCACRYPMDPPQIKFITKVYHPNIDSSNGLICLDLLKKPPHGKWTPVINLCSLLTAIQQLLADPNPHDPLDAAVVSWLYTWPLLHHLLMFCFSLQAQEYITNRSLFLKNATLWTQQFAMVFIKLKSVFSFSVIYFLYLSLI